MAEKELISNNVLKSPRFYGRRKGRPLRQSMKRRLDEVLPELLFQEMASIK